MAIIVIFLLVYFSTLYTHLSSAFIHDFDMMIFWKVEGKVSDHANYELYDYLRIEKWTQYFYDAALFLV